MPPGCRGTRSICPKGRHPRRAALAMLAVAALLVPLLAAATAGAEETPSMTPAPTAEDGTSAIAPVPAIADDAPATTPAPEHADDAIDTGHAPDDAGDTTMAAPATDGEADAVETAPSPAGAAASDTARAPGPGPKPPKALDAPPPGTELDETVIRLLLDTAGLDDFRVLDPDRVAADWPEATFMWANDHNVDRPQDLVYGMMIEQPVDGQADFDRDVRRIVVKWSADCDGKSGVRMDIRETLSNGKFARRAAYKCTDSDGALLARGFFVGGENALVGFVHFFTEPGRARGEAADAALYRTFLAIMND